MPSAPWETLTHMHFGLVALLCMAISLCQRKAAAGPSETDPLFSTLEDTPLSLAAPGIVANGNFDGPPNFMAVLLTPPALGELQLNAEGSFTYHPPADCSGQKTFAYQLITETGPTVLQVDSDAARLTNTINLETFSLGATPKQADDHNQSWWQHVSAVLSTAGPIRDDTGAKPGYH